MPGNITSRMTQVVVALQREVQTIFTIVRKFNGEAGLAQALAEVVPGLGLVFDDQYFHVTGFCVINRRSVCPSWERFANR